MAFTIRSLFQGNNENQPAGGTAIMEPSAQPPPLSQGGMQMPMNSPFGMEVPPASPFGGSLFKTREPEPLNSGSPIAAMASAGGSPFSPMGAASGLTVADVLPQLPPELARANSLPPDQPITIAPHLIEAALSNGQAAIPIFEIYRVCPAIFQAPVSPQDPRQVPLPASKLPSLISAAQGAVHPSPFAAQSGPPPMPAAPSPFGAVPSDVRGAAPMADPAMRQAAILPPRRDNGVPPASFGTPSPFGAPVPAPHSATPSSPFGQPSPFGEPAAAASPFSFSQPAPTVAPQPPPMPFAEVPPPPAAPPSLFGNATPANPVSHMPAAQPGSLMSSSFFGANSTPAAPVSAQAPSPFAMPEQPAAPYAPEQSSPASPFAASPFGHASPPPFALTEPEVPKPLHAAPPLPFGMPSAPATQPAVPQPMAPPSALPAAPASGGGPLKLSLATLLKGYTNSDLGFDSGMVPSWIMTSVPAQALQNPSPSGDVQVELGLLIDGTTDIGFRNVLSSARRDLQIKLPASELSQSLPAAPNPPAPPSPAIPVMPPAAPASPFGAPDAVGMNPLAPQAPSQPSQPLNPFAAAKAPAMSGPLSPMSTPPGASGPIQPKPNVNFGFAMPQPAPLAPAETPASAPAPVVQPKPVTSFDPFAASTNQPWSGQTPPAVFPQPQISEGFSSDQLFGAPTPPLPLMPEPPAPPPAAAPTIEPAPRSFTALPGIPLPPAFDGLGSVESSVPSPFPKPAPLPPPVVNPFSGPLKNAGAPVSMPSFTAPASPPPLEPASVPPLTPMPPAFTLPPPPPAALQSDVPSFMPSPQSRPLMPPMPVMAPAAPAALVPQASGPILGISRVELSDSEQVMLRALLGVNENLTADRVVELISKLPGIAACSCVHGSTVVSHGDSSFVAADFKRQSADLSRSIKALAPLIGIADAETFSINTNERLMTFSFHPPVALGVLHQDNDLASGLRDKITLVGRELSRMVMKTSAPSA